MREKGFLLAISPTSKYIFVCNSAPTISWYCNSLIFFLFCFPLSNNILGFVSYNVLQCVRIIVLNNTSNKYKENELNSLHSPYIYFEKNVFHFYFVCYFSTIYVKFRYEYKWNFSSIRKYIFKVELNTIKKKGRMFNA